MDILKLRRALPSDIPAIQEIWRESMALHAERDTAFRARHDGHVVFGRFVAKQMTSREAVVFVMQLGANVAAYGICVPRRRLDCFEEDRHALITDLDVAADHRRKGLGEIVLIELCDWARGAGFRRIEAEVITANEIADSFWRKHGFSPYYQSMYRTLHR